MLPQSFSLIKLISLHLGDGWLIDVETRKWREVDHPFKNKPRCNSLFEFCMNMFKNSFRNNWKTKSLWKFTNYFSVFFPRLWHTACPGKDSDVIVFGGSCDYILLVDTVSTNETQRFSLKFFTSNKIISNSQMNNV